MNFWAMSIAMEGVPESVRGVLSHPELERAWLVNLQIDQAVYGKASETLKGASLDTVEETRASESGLSFLWTLLGMVLVAFAVWTYGRTNQPVNSHFQRTRGKVLTLAFLGAGI